MNYRNFLRSYFEAATENDPLRVATQCALLMIEHLSALIHAIPVSGKYDKRDYELPSDLCEMAKRLHYVYMHPASDLVQMCWVAHAANCEDKIVYLRGTSGLFYVPTWHLLAWSLTGDFLDGFGGLRISGRKALEFREALTQEGLQQISGSICSQKARFLELRPHAKRPERIKLGLWREYARAAHSNSALIPTKLLPKSVPKYESLTGTEQRIIETLAACGHRLTTAELLSELEKKYGATSEGTTKQALAAMVRNGLLTNRRNPKPRGYGLAEWKD